MVLLQDLAIVEGWIYDGDYKGALLTKQQIIDRLEYAKLAGYIDRTIVLYAQMCPKGEEHPTKNGPKAQENEAAAFSGQRGQLEEGWYSSCLKS